MPKVRREQLPDRLLVHLLARVRQRSISCEQLIRLARWLDTERRGKLQTPTGLWSKAQGWRGANPG